MNERIDPQLPYQVLLFDLGGVLLNIDYQLTEKAFQDLGYKNFQELYSQAVQTGLFDDFETGKIDEETFVEALRTLHPTDIASEEIIIAWNAMLLDFPPSRMEMLQTLKKSHKLLLLSNTNSIHYKAFTEIFKSSIDVNFESLFDSIYYSHEIGLRKPNADVFKHVMKKDNLSPAEVLYIDDSAQHIEAAKNLGINSILLEKGEEVEDLLKSLGVLT